MCGGGGGGGGGGRGRLYAHSKAVVMSGRSVNLTTIFLARLSG